MLNKVKTLIILENDKCYREILTRGEGEGTIRGGTILNRMVGESLTQSDISVKTCKEMRAQIADPQGRNVLVRRN